jgi:hypothetical protein
VTTAQQIVQAVANGRVTPAEKRELQTHPAIVDGRPRKILRCANCARNYTVSDRTHREIKATGKQPRCPECRRVHHIKVTAEHLSFWLHTAYDEDGTVLHHGFTPAECRQLADNIFG